MRLGEIIKLSAASNQLWIEYHVEAITKFSKTAEILQVTSIVANQRTKKLPQRVTTIKFLYFLLQLSSSLEQCYPHPKEQSHLKLLYILI
jgi:hypothetical protein